jgi:hypothetical protein
MELTARRYWPAARRLVRQLGVKRGPARLPIDLVAGEGIELRASGALVAAGAARNLPGDPFAFADPGTAVAVVGGRLDGVIVGRFVRLVAPSSGGVIVGLNDLDPADTSGAVSFRLSVTRPSVDAWRTGRMRRACDGRTETASRAFIDSLQALNSTTLDPGQVAKIIRSRYLEGMRRCQERSPKKGPVQGGRVSVRLTVGPTGGVTTVVVKGFDPTVDACLDAIARKWRFGAPKDVVDGRPTQADFDLSLTLSAS